MNVEEFCALLKQSKQFDVLEIKILQAMLALEKSKKIKNTASDIASASNLSVTNAYKYLYSLQKKGIIEYDDSKNKIFWLSRTSPFPRLFSFLGKQYLERKEMFKKLDEFYSKSVSKGGVWLGMKVFERFESEDEFVNRTAFLLDIAEEEVLITAEDFAEDFIIIDAVRRAIERDIKIKILCLNITKETEEKMKKIGVEVKFMDRFFQPFIMVVDSRHGIAIEMKSHRGVWFLNQDNDYRRKFMELWQKVQK